MERMGFIRIREAGLSLVEVMVALVVGLITVLVVMQVFTAFEGDKRTTMGVSDAQMEAVSYGKEKPAAQGASEADYAKNRRVEIRY